MSGAHVPAPTLTGAAAMFALPGAPTVTYEPAELAEDWVFMLAAHGRRQRMRHTELVALYRSCDEALNAARKAAR